MCQTSIRAFTLIELLVVITIIVVLLALLTPALDKAIYQANLVVCGSTQGALGKASTAYAMSYRRSYPRNRDVRAEAWQLETIFWEAAETIDMRAAVESYTTLDTLLDPFLEPLDLSRQANQRGTMISANYSIWFNFRLTGPLAGAPLLKVGDRVGFVDDKWQTPGRPGPRRSRIMLHDINVTRDDDYSYTSHPDKQGVLGHKYNQDQPFTSEPGMEQITSAGGGFSTIALRHSYARWRGGGLGDPRGHVDLNFTFTDGSVHRYNNVELRDERLTPAPGNGTTDNEEANRYKVFLPAE